MGHLTSGGATISRSWFPPWASALAGGAILVALVAQLGAKPFVEALASVNVVAILAAGVITAGTTWACARRWRLLADRLGVGVSPAAAYRAYYRAQFLNATLPSGVVGEVDRALNHGRSTSSMSRGIRSVLWDRVSGQAVLFGLTVLAIPVLAPPLRSWLLWLLAATAALALMAHKSDWGFARALRDEARDVPGAPGVWSRVLLLSTLAVAGHVTVFIVAARSVGVAASTLELAALALIVLQISAIPLAIAGWGPREGGTALVFGAAGLDAGTGLAVSVTYGVLATLATLPGVLALRRRRAAGPTGDPEGGTSWATVPTRS